MQSNNNPTTYDEIVQGIIHPISENFFLTLHLLLSCYFTFILYIAALPHTDGTICLLWFFIDWHINAILLYPLMRYSRKVIRKPLGIPLFLITLLGIFFLTANYLAHTLQGAINLLPHSGYMPIIIQLLVK